LSISPQAGRREKGKKKKRWKGLAPLRKRKEKRNEKGLFSPARSGGGQPFSISSFKERGKGKKISWDNSCGGGKKRA